MMSLSMTMIIQLHDIKNMQFIAEVDLYIMF